MKKSPSPQFTPEQELLLWSIRVDHTKDQQIGEILKAGVDWKYIRETAIQHGIIPLLYKRLKEDMGDLVPPEELSEFRKLFMANAVNNIRMTQQLLKVLNMLADAGVEAMPFKGPALAVQAYGDLSIRSFSDLDVLIHEKDFDLSYYLLTKNGFVPECTIDSITKKKLAMRKKDLSFSKENFFLEVHFNFFERYQSVNLDIAHIRKQRKSVSLNEQIVWTISNNDLLVILCIHGTMHLWNHLKWLADISYLITHSSDLNWDEILKLGNELGVKRIILISLLLAEKFCGLKLPPKIKELFDSDKYIYKLATKSSSFFIQDNEKMVFTFPIYYFKSRELLRHKIGYGFFFFVDNILFPGPRDYKIISFPEPLFPLYFGIHQIRLTIEYIPSLIRFIKTWI